MIAAPMNNENTFSYTYSAKENQEILNIRKKYMPQEESKLDELKRLDDLVQTSGMTASLCAGIGGALIFGSGMCLAMEVIGHMVWLGVGLGLIGMAGILFAYPVYRKFFAKAKEKYAPRILQLTEGVGHCALIGPDRKIICTNHALDGEERSKGSFNDKPITIGDNVWLGANVTELPGVTIGKDAIIGGRSVVTKDIPENVIAAGDPRKVLYEVTEDDRLEK